MKKNNWGRMLGLKKINTLGERFGLFFAGLSIFLLILTIIIFVISLFFKKDFILHEIIQLYSGVCFTLCFCSTFIMIMFMTRNWLWKGLLCFITVAFFYATITLIHTSTLIYKDKIAYENKRFEKVVGIPNKVEYDNPDSGPRMVFEIVFDDVTIDALNLWMRQDYFEKNLDGKKLEILYLPNSHYAIEIREVGDGG